MIHYFNGERREGGKNINVWPGGDSGSIFWPRCLTQKINPQRSDLYKATRISNQGQYRDKQLTVHSSSQNPVTCG